MVIVIYIFAFVLMFAAVVYRFTFGLRKRPGQTSETQFVDIVLSKKISANGTITRHRVSAGKNASTSFVLVPD
jgi:hypothetical protein